MAEVKHFYAELNNLQTNSQTGFTNELQVSGGDLTANTKYLIIARALIAAESATDKVGIRVQALDDSNIASKSDTYYEMEQTGSTNMKSWFFVHSFTTDSSPNTVSIQTRSPGSGDVYSDQLSLLLIDLDDLGSGNYFEDINAATGTELATSFGSHALITGAGLGVTDEHLVLACMKIGIGSTGRTFTVELSLADDSASSSRVNSVTEEGEDTAEERMVGLVGRHKAVTSNVNVRIYALEEAANGNMTDEGSYMIALNMSAFADFEHDYDDGNLNVASEQTLASVGPYTPTTNGNHLIIGRVGSTSGSAAGAEILLHLEDGTTETRTGDSTPTHDQVWDTSKDAECAFTMERISISSSKTYNLRANSAGAIWTSAHRWLLVLNLNLASSGTDYTETSTDDADVTDSTSRVHDATRTPTEALGVTDATSRIASAVRTQTDAVGVTDETTHALTIIRTVTDAVGTTDDTIAAVTLAVVVTDAVDVTDATNRVAPAVRVVTDQVGAIDAATQAEENAEASVETVAVTDATTRIHDAVRASTEPVTVTDAATPVKTITVEIVETVGVEDQTVRVVPSVRAIVEPVNVTDDTAASKASVQVITETVGVTDLAIDDLTGGATEYTRTVTDDVGATDDTVAAVTAVRLVTDPVGVIDDTQAVKAIVQTVTDDVDVTDDTQAVKAIQVTVTDDVAVTDVTSRIAAAVRLVTDQVGAIDAATQAEENVEASVETVAITDQTARVHDAQRSSTEAVSVTDLATAIKSIAVEIVESVGVTDQTTRVAPVVRVVTEAVTVDDATIQAEVNAEASIEPVGVTDDTLRVHNAKRTVTETVGVTDLAIDDLTVPPVEEEIRPVSDIAAAGWDTAPTGSEPLWEQLDELTPSDTDYIFALTP